MNSKTKGSPLVNPLILLTAIFPAAGFSIVALLFPTQEGQCHCKPYSHWYLSSTNTHSKNNIIILAEKPFLIEHGKTLAATQINQTHLHLSLVGNGAITLPNSTGTVLTKDTGNSIASEALFHAKI